MRIDEIRDKVSCGRCVVRRTERGREDWLTTGLLCSSMAGAVSIMIFITRDWTPRTCDRILLVLGSPCSGTSRGGSHRTPLKIQHFS